MFLQREGSFRNRRRCGRPAASDSKVGSTELIDVCVHSAQPFSKVGVCPYSHLTEGRQFGFAAGGYRYTVSFVSATGVGLRVLVCVSPIESGGSEYPLAFHQSEGKIKATSHHGGG